MRKKEDIYSLLNEVELLENEFEEAEVTEIEKARVKKYLNKNIKKKRNYKKYIAIAIVSLIIAGIGILKAEPAIAYNIPLIGDFLLEKEIQKKEYEKYAEIINQKKKIGNIEIQLEYALIDNNNLEVGYIVTDDKGRLKEESEELSDIIHKMYGSLFINGEQIFYAAGGRDERIDKHKVKIIKNYEIPNIEKDGEINIELKINELLNQKGDFGFKFILDKTEINKNSKYIKDIHTKDENIKIKSLSVTPLSVVLTGEINEINDFIAIDNNGKQLINEGYSYSGKTKESKYSYIPNENMKNIEFIPIIKQEKINDDTGVLNKPIKLDFNCKDEVLKLNDDRGIKIHEVYKEDDFVIINFSPWAKEEIYNIYTTDLYIKDGEKILTHKFDESREVNSRFDKYRKEGYNIGWFKVSDFDNLEVGIRYWDIEKILKDKSFKIDIDK